MITETKITVRYAETDQMGIAHHSNYAVWFEQSRTEMILKAGGLHYKDMEEMGILLPLLELGCKFRVPALYEDELTIRTAITELAPAKVTFRYLVYKDGIEKPISSGFTRHAFVGQDMRPMRLNKKFPEVYALLESLAEPEFGV